MPDQMSVERTGEVFGRYADADDLSTLADDVVYRIMATGEAFQGLAGIRQLFGRMYEQAFQADAYERSRVVGAGRVAAEWEFVGTHIAEFDGVPATGKAVRIPFIVMYDLRDDHIVEARVYFEYPVFHAQVSA